MTPAVRHLTPDVPPPQTRPGLHTYLAATRPGFLTITLLAVLVGLALPGQPWSMTALLVLIAALAMHGGANALNDVHDAALGSDACNTDRISPFTGGSRLIQEQRLSAAAMHRLALALLAFAAVAGLPLLPGRPGLLAIGAAGLLLAWAYSAPPLQLMRRGLGEPAVGLAWTLIVVGADYSLRGEWAAAPWFAGGMLGLLVANILLANQFPDFRADQAAGKRNWVVRLGPRAAARWYGRLAGTAGLLLAAGIGIGALPATTIAAALPLLLAVRVNRLLARHAEQPAQLGLAIRLNLLVAHAAALALLAGIALG